MDYALLLCFDAVSENRFLDLIRTISDRTKNGYMLDAKIPPHITVSFFRTSQISPIVEAIDNRISEFHTGKIEWASLGVFIPHVLFAAPVLDTYLTDCCVLANDIVGPLSDVGDEGHYLPGQWVAHTALAVRLSPDELKTAFEVALSHFLAVKGESIKLVLGECNPYKEVKVWNLRGS